MFAVVDIRSSPGLEPSEFEKQLFAQNIKKNIKQYMATGGVFKHPTGRLRDSINVAIAGDSIYIMSDLPYAEVQDQGSKQIKWYLRTAQFLKRTEKWKRNRILKKASLKQQLTPTGNIFGKKFVWTGVELAKLETPEIMVNRAITLNENSGGRRNELS